MGKKKRRGRKSKEEFIDHRLKVLHKLHKDYLIGSVKSETILEYADVRKMCGDADPRTALQICRDISDFCTLVGLYERGIQADKSNFYMSNMTKDRKTKTRIAHTLCKHVDDISPIGIAFGPGSNTTISSQVLAQNYKLPEVIVSNSLGVYEALRGYEGSNLILTGGEYKKVIHAFVGRAAVAGFKKVNCEACVMGVSAINIGGELLVKFPDEPDVLEQMLRSTTETIFIVTTVKKFVSRDTFPVMSIDEILTEIKNVKVNIVTNHYRELETTERRQQAKEVAEALTNIDSRVKIIWAENDKAKAKRKNR